MISALTTKLEIDIRLLNLSIEHWERIMWCDPKEVPSWQQCALCRMYIKDYCRSCPIKHDTQRPYCERTPYSSVHHYWRNMKGDPYFVRRPVPFEYYCRAEIAYLTRILHNLEAKLKEETNHD